MSLTRWDPFREMVSLREAMSRMFDEGLGRWGEREGWRPGMLSVPMDVYETDDDVVVTAELPGVKPEDVDIRITGNTLTIKGESHEEQEQQQGNVHYRERRYGSFQRSLVLPSNVDTNSIDATFENGLLKIKASKSEEAKPRQIQVHSASGASQGKEIEAGKSRRR